MDVFVAHAGFLNVKLQWVAPCSVSWYFWLFFITPSIPRLSAHRFCTAVWTAPVRTRSKAITCWALQICRRLTMTRFCIWRMSQAVNQPSATLPPIWATCSLLLKVGEFTERDEDQCVYARMSESTTEISSKSGFFWEHAAFLNLLLEMAPRFTCSERFQNGMCDLNQILQLHKCSIPANSQCYQCQKWKEIFWIWLHHVTHSLKATSVCIQTYQAIFV